MSKQKIILLVVALVVIGGGAGVLQHLKSNQRLGEPGVKTELPPGHIPGTVNLHVVLPELVLNYKSIEKQQDAIVTNTLPRDTSYGQRVYVDESKPGDWVIMNVVLMGTDRTSMHKPQYCLEGMGLRIDPTASSETTIPISEPQPYDLPVIKLVASGSIRGTNGAAIPTRAVYVYWFVADGALSGDKSGGERMWSMAKNLMQTGVLQRWAYVSCFAACPPGGEEAAYERVKRFITASVPKFQLTPKPATAVTANP